MIDLYEKYSNASNKQMTEVVKNYIDRHQNDTPGDYHILDNFSKHDMDRIKTIYFSLLNEIEWPDNENDEIYVEISSHVTKSGHTEIFSF
jgi:hypothetical protein|tara:strand:+ start:162 stop:431 length:270 start_codon:yes stop_codon:yes gene_type:complete